jgi:hypothetical protein
MKYIVFRYKHVYLHLAGSFWLVFSGCYFRMSTEKQVLPDFYKLCQKKYTILLP